MARNPFQTAIARLTPPTAPRKRSAFEAGASNRLTGDFLFATSRSADGDLQYELKTMRNRARDLARNSPFGKRYQQVVAEKVVGPRGFRLKAKNFLKDGTDLHRSANVAIQEAWEKFCKPTNSDITKKLTLTAQLQVAFSNWATDGEILARFHRGPRFGPFGLAIQWLDPDFLDETLNREPVGTENMIRQGVELDEFGAPVAYWLWTRHPSDASSDRERVRVPASDIIHAFIPLRIGQSRGIPHAHAIEITLKMLGGYIEAELTAARIAAAKMGALIDAVEDGSAPAVSPNAGGGQDGDEGSGGDSYTSADPGTLMDLRGKAAKLQLWDPQHPTSAFPDFTRMMAHFASMGYGMSYGTLTGDLSQANYGSLRVGMLDERDHWETYQVFGIDHVMERIYGEFLKMALLNGQIRTINDMDTDRWGRHAFRARGFPWIDPLKDVQGDLLEVGAGIQTLTRMAAAQGDDFEELVEERAEELEILEEYGVVSTLSTAITATANEPNDGGTSTDATAGDDETDGSGKALNSGQVRRLLAAVTTPLQRPRRAARG